MYVPCSRPLLQHPHRAHISASTPTKSNYHFFLCPLTNFQLHALLILWRLSSYINNSPNYSDTLIIKKEVLILLLGSKNYINITPYRRYQSNSISNRLLIPLSNKKSICFGDGDASADYQFNPNYL